jgi:hypothetical protein
MDLVTGSITCFYGEVEKLIWKRKVWLHKEILDLGRAPLYAYSQIEPGVAQSLASETTEYLWVGFTPNKPDIHKFL